MAAVFHMFSRSVQGERHRRQEAETGLEHCCQDMSGHEELSVLSGGKKGKKRGHIIYVCDGHGGAAYFRSRRGAELAGLAVRYVCKSALEKYTIEYLSGSAARGILAGELVSVWNTLVRVDMASNPVTQSELSKLELMDRILADEYRRGMPLSSSVYGTTVLAACFCEDGWFAFQIGDGKLAARSGNGSWCLPLGLDPLCFMNRTTSLCDDSAAAELRFYAAPQIPCAVFCSTDGLDGSFITDNRLYSFYDNLLWLYKEYAFDCCRNCGRKYCSKECRMSLAETEINSYLPNLSRKGSGDDVSLALCLCMDSGERLRKPAL